jgi:hypothetical protein
MMTLEQRKRLSKFLSLVLRHEPQRLDLRLDDEGWVLLRVSNPWRGSTFTCRRKPIRRGSSAGGTLRTRSSWLCEPGRRERAGSGSINRRNGCFFRQPSRRPSSIYMQRSEIEVLRAMIRAALVEDAPAIVDLSERKRREYQAYQPQFWRKATDSREKQLPFIERLIESDRVIALVHEGQGRIDGFVIASLMEAPPVYDPGGQTCMIDDFAVGDPGDWPRMGHALLAAARQAAEERGAVQTVVVCGHRDDPKRRMLAADGFSLASEWYVRERD